MHAYLLAISLHVASALPVCNWRRNGRIYVVTTDYRRHMCDATTGTWIPLDKKRTK